MSKTEINEMIEMNKATIRDAKNQIKQLNAHLNFINQYNGQFESSPLFGVADCFEEAIRYQETRIEQANGFLAKRKKQLKLMAQLEALENE